MEIDRIKAKHVLEEAVASSQPGPESWRDLIRTLSYECEGGANKTFIAMIGTAILAKATEIDADPFALQSGIGTPGAYSARGLCQFVLAAHAPRLGIDLGVTGREPLNNQPFFAEKRVHKDLPVKPKARRGFTILLDGLNQLGRITHEAEARAALCAFVQERRRARYRGARDLFAPSGMTAKDLLAAIRGFVGERSEHGKRAQATAAGLLELIAPGTVIADKIHDPDRHYPGDVNVVEEGRTTHAFEVRDKPLLEADIYHFITKVAAHTGARAGIVAVAANQPPLSLAEASAFATHEGVTLEVFLDWASFLNAIMFWSRRPEREAVQAAYRAIHTRAVELEVSEAGIRLWETYAT